MTKESGEPKEEKLEDLNVVELNEKLEHLNGRSKDLQEDLDAAGPLERGAIIDSQRFVNGEVERVLAELDKRVVKE